MSGSIYDGEVLDLRELILVLWRRKWLILGITFLAGALVFIISRYLVPTRYQTSAIVTITDRTTMAALELNSLSNLAVAADLQKEVLDSSGISDMEAVGLYSLTADADVRSQLILSVTAADPDLAAEVANIWAEVAAKKINALYGTSEESLAVLEEEILQAEEIWAAANLELEGFRSESGLNIYPAQLTAAQYALEETLLKIERNKLLLIDIQSLTAQLDVIDPASYLPVSTKLNLINLQARLTDFQEVSPLPIPADEPTLSLSEAKIYLQDLQSVLESQTQLLEDEATTFESEIKEISQYLEEDQNRDAQLKQIRDQAFLVYKRLLSSLEDKKLLQIQEESYIQISSKALPPQEPTQSNLVTRVSFAVVSAGLLSILGCLFQDWWVKKGQP